MGIQQETGVGGGLERVGLEMRSRIGGRSEEWWRKRWTSGRKREAREVGGPVRMREGRRDVDDQLMW